MTLKATDLPILLVAALLPFSEESVVVCGVPIYLHEFAILSAAISPTFRLKKVVFRREILVPLLLILCGAVGSAIFSGADRAALGIIKSWIVFPILFGILLVDRFRRSPGFADRFLAIWLLGSFFLAAVSIFFPIHEGFTFDGRLRGASLSPNHLALSLSPAVLIGSYLLISGPRRPWIVRAAVIIFLAVISSAIFLTESLGAIIGLSFGFLVFFGATFCWRKFGSAVMTRLLLSFFWLALVLSAAFLIFRWEELSSGLTRDSLSSRVMIWNASGRMLQEDPILGIGPGNFQERYLALQSEYPPYLEWAVPHPHNTFLAIWLSFGLGGLIGFFLLLRVLIRNVAGVLTKWSLDDGYLGEGQLPAVLSFAFLSLVLVHGLVDMTILRNDLSIHFAAFSSIILSLPVSGKSREIKNFPVGKS